MHALPDAMLAYTPFLEPLPLPQGAWWLTIVPMAFFIAVAYKAVRRNSLNGYWKSTTVMAVQIVFFIALAGFAVHAVVEWAVPALGG